LHVRCGSREDIGRRAEEREELSDEGITDRAEDRRRDERERDGL